MTDKKKHHYVPQFILKNFSIYDDSKRIYRYNKKEPFSPKVIGIKDVAMEKHFYTTGKDTKEKDSNSVEIFLAEIESKASPIIKKILNNENIDENGKEVVSEFIAMMYLRTPSAKRLTKDFLSKILEQTLKIAVGNGWIKNIGEEFNVKDMTICGKKVKIEIKDDYAIYQMLNTMENISHLINSMNWIVFDCEDKKDHFLISDHPVVLDKHSEGVYSDMRHKNSSILFPISPTKCIMCLWNENLTDVVTRCKATNKTLRNFNEHQVINAEKYIFSSCTGMEKLIDRHKNSYISMELLT